ncbi:hypothetical protein EVAR_56629_1 [Eumeta japonica]|uniref:Carbohydrate kinase PfkB domain-containing protein n=1 Tax=Eumeta variegata TaxID=151549 RepID=A0A4C1XIK2_EUMVA|nr:hypothetical protein EVAR_56629_1 [Eumeta japonica]
MNTMGVITVKRSQRHDKDTENNFCMLLYPITPLDNVKSVSGAGDCFTSGFIYGMISKLNEQQCVTVGFEAAKAALNSMNTVPHDFKISDVPKEAYCKRLV